MNIARNMTELIGNTPLVYAETLSTLGRVALKLEFFNPLGCVKERIALSMVEAAEASGELNPGGTIVEPTSGNTGIGLAGVAAVKGYRVILTMPESMSLERRKLLTFLGAELILTPAGDGMKGAIDKARELAAAIPGAFLPLQFSNPANPRAHREGTAEEIWRDTEGGVDILVAGVGTGGTITGLASALKGKNRAITAVAVEPAGSPVLSGGAPGKHGIQGIGAGFIPENYDPSVVDRIIQIDDAAALESARSLARREGILTGISGGAAAAAAARLAAEPENRGRLIVAILPDTGERYLSTPLFDPPAFR